MPALTAALIAAGPVATLAAAHILSGSVRADTARISQQLAPRLADEARVAAARDALGHATARAPVGATLDALAQVLPADATLVRAERRPDGALDLDILTADPDQLRAAVRRSPDFARMRDTSQRHSDAAMIVSMRQVAP